MKETRYFYVPDASGREELPEEEALHAVRVLRLKEDDEVMLMDGSGTFYKAKVTMTNGKHCFYTISETMPQERIWQGHLHLAIAPTKMMERMEWLVEKATEIGIDEISFLDCAFSERRNIKLPRIEKILISAVKQSRKPWMPQLNEMQGFKKFIDCHQTGRRYIAHCYQEVPRLYLFDELRKSDEQDALVLVGPEGDFSIDEVNYAIERGFVSVDLGKSRLRTETAGLTAVMMMQLST
ncbi:MAG: 16S rRNA (uracil(1498)-N(3))-methyltransferase [Prevotella sp.]|nr:16S rRNA (uracil(1498)-N(3))-methyltransferase [Prevotella sp.]